jgi:TolB-like protein
MKSARRGWLFASLLAIGCAHAPGSTTASPTSSTSPTAPTRIKLAVLPLDNRDFPAIALSVNNVLHDVKVRGVDDYFLSKATLEVVQLSIECVQPTSDCYRSVGKSLSANRLLLGQVLGVGKRKRDKSVRVTITLFDVDAGEPANVVDRVYKTPELASQGAQDLVAEAAEPARPFGPEEQQQRSPKASRPMASGAKQ